MKVKDSNYADYQTSRQWALRGYLPVDGASGVELWANAYCKGRTRQERSRNRTSSSSRRARKC